jgi:sugar-specific transcriptional regulator TrmB
VKIQEFLQKKGFGVNDIKVYLDIVKHSQCFASSVSLRTGIDRTTVYSSIKRLLKKGVIAQTKVNDVNAYVAVAPQIFVENIDQEMRGLKEQRLEAENFVKEVQKLETTAFEKPNVRIYEGEQAIINLYEETLRNGGTQKAFIKIINLPDRLKNFFKGRFIEAKKEKNVFSKVIVANSKFAEKYCSTDDRSARKTKIVKSHPFEMHAEILLFGTSSVAIVDFHEQIYGMVIESATMYKTIDAMFEYIWQNEA